MEQSFDDRKQATQPGSVPVADPDPGYLEIGRGWTGDFCNEFISLSYLAGALTDSVAEKSDPEVIRRLAQGLLDGIGKLKSFSEYASPRLERVRRALGAEAEKLTLEDLVPAATVKALDQAIAGIKSAVKHEGKVTVIPVAQILAIAQQGEAVIGRRLEVDSAIQKWQELSWEGNGIVLKASL